MRIWVAGVFAAAILGVSASSASASDVWLWACHGPNGQALTDIQLKLESSGGGSYANLPAGGCGTAGSEAGVRLTAPAAGSTATLEVTVPEGVDANRVRIVRRANGLAAGTYTASYNGTPVADADLAATAPEFPVSGNGPLTLKLSCTDTCAGSLDVLGVAFQVTDDDAPFSLGVGRSNPVVTTHETGNEGGFWFAEAPLSLSAKDTGLGLDYALVSIYGPGMSAPRDIKVPLSPNCTDLSPGNATNDRPLERKDCLLDASALSSTAFAWRDVLVENGNYGRTVIFYDVAGNPSTALENEIFEGVVMGRPLSTRTLSIGTDPVTIQENPGPGPATPGGGVQGAQSNQCRTPRLSVVLNSKPVRVTKGTPVLAYKKAYKFTGRLTCVINGKRRSAPKRTKLFVYNKVGKKTVRKPNTAIRDKGAVNVKLAFVSNRTVIFRYTNATGQKSEVKIKVRVTKKKK
jgi:hypothetical protein